MAAGGGFLRRLARNTAGNTLVIMGMAVIPLAGLVGGAVDVSRLYLTKTRLQQACDAGALAGRKVMGGGAWNANSNAANTVAVNFFDSNFQNGAYGTTGRTRAFTESGGKVTGTASAVVPMTIMKIFRQSARTLTVTCDAEMALPNTDVMFVLDVTGSMAEVIPGDSSRKIDGMHRAVKCFYETLAKLDTTENCGTTPTGGTSSQVQIRFGFVPYSTNVNVGKLLPASYFAPTWKYQTRLAHYTAGFYPVISATTETYWEYYTGSTAPHVSRTLTTTTATLTEEQCEYFMENRSISGLFTRTASTSGGPAPADEFTSEWDDDGNATATNGGGWGGGPSTPGEWGWSGAYDTSGTNRSCRRLRTDTRKDYSDTLKYRFNGWTYKQVDDVDVTDFVADPADDGVLIATSNDGYVSNSGTYDMRELAAAPGATGISTTTSRWDGCIEERPTVQSVTDFDPIPGTAYDLDIDLVPSSGNPNSLWGPIWNRLHFSRRSGSSATTSERVYSATADDSESDANRSSYSCAPPGKLLQSWADPTLFETYVATLQPTSNTYHDIGLLWGARLLSPTGIFAAQNAATPSGGTIERHLIFMTDGTAVADSMNQTAYGVAWYDRRQTASGTAPTNAELVTQIQERMQGLCMAVRNKNITLWVIYFGSVSSGDATRMEACATPGKYYAASNNSQLATIFASIATQISQLRLTQ